MTNAKSPLFKQGEPANPYPASILACSPRTTMVLPTKRLTWSEMGKKPFIQRS